MRPDTVPVMPAVATSHQPDVDQCHSHGRIYIYTYIYIHMKSSFPNAIRANPESKFAMPSIMFLKRALHIIIIHQELFICDRLFSRTQSSKLALQTHFFGSVLISYIYIWIVIHPFITCNKLCNAPPPLHPCGWGTSMHLTGRLRGMLLFIYTDLYIMHYVNINLSYSLYCI